MRFVKNLRRKTTTPITSKMWISPPNRWRENPPNQAIISSIATISRIPIVFFNVPIIEVHKHHRIFI